MSFNITSAQVTVTASGSAHTLGNFATLRAAGTHPRAEAITVTLSSSGTGTGNYILELYQGPSDTLIGKIPFAAQYTGTQYDFDLPVAIPADVQVRAKVQCSNASRTCVITIQGHEVSPFFCAGADTFDALAADGGTSVGYVDVTAGNGSFGTAASINASTAAAYNFFVIYGRSAATGGASVGVFRFNDDGVDISGSSYLSIGNNTGTPFQTCAWADVAAGSDMTIDGNCNSATYNTFRVQAIGVTLATPATGSLVYTEADMQSDARPLSATGQILTVQLLATDGTPITGKTHSDVTCSLAVDGAAPSAQTLVTMTLGTYTSLGFKEQGALAPGRYAFCPATLPSSGNRAVYTFTGSGIRQAQLVVDLLGSDPRVAALTVPEIIAAEKAALDGFVADADSMTLDGTAFTLTRTSQAAITGIVAD